MANVSPEIAAKQAEYAARPWFVYWVDSHCKVPRRFDTFDEAFDFVQDQWQRIVRTTARDRYSASNMWSDHWGSYIEGPGLKCPLGYLTMAPDVSSY